MSKQIKPSANVNLDEIRIDGGTQPRLELDNLAVEEYAEDMREGALFPPLQVVYDGSTYWLWDGFHRWHAFRKANRKIVTVEITQGGVDDARWLSLSANKAHGLRRKKEDIENSIKRALSLRPGTPDAAIAEHIGVTRTTILNHRHRLESTCQIDKSTIRTCRDGRTINTSNIGRGRDDDEPDPTTQPQEYAAFARTRGDLIRQIADACGVHHSTVAEWLEEQKSDSNPTDQPQAEGEIDPPHQDYPDEDPDTASLPATATGSEPEQEGEPAEPCDCNNVPLPPQAIPAFDDLPDLGRLCRDIDALIRRVEEFVQKPGGYHMRSRAYASDLKRVRSSLWNLRPAHVCPYCQGSKADCRVCQGQGWVTRHTYANATDGKEGAVK